jgi:hypothetical protein
MVEEPHSENMLAPEMNPNMIRDRSVEIWFDEECFGSVAAFSGSIK